MAEPIRVLISAGELSGDEHAGGVLRALRRSDPVEARGMGGRNLRSAGMTTDIDCERGGSIMGFAAVLTSLRRLRAELAQMKELCKTWRPDVLLIVDYPDFNLRLARLAHRSGIPVLYFIPPKVWAWRSGRIAQMQECVDSIAFIFPFERAFYEARGYTKGTYVGHPMVAKMAAARASEADRADLLLALGLDPRRPAIALFPGSRSSEIARLTPRLGQAFANVQSKLPEVQGIIGVASTIAPELISANLPAKSTLRLYQGDSIQLLRCVDAAVLKSGTSNLQAAFADLPFAMFYETSAFSAFMARRLVHVKEYSPVNVIRPGTIHEILQEELTLENLSQEMLRLLSDHPYRRTLQNGLAEVRELLSTCDENALFKNAANAYERVAKLVLSFRPGSGVN